MPGVLRDRLRITTCAAVLVALASSGGCGSDAQPRAKATRAPDRAAKQCRAQWADLADQIKGNEDRTEPSAEASRWNSVVGTVDYYATSARSSDCDGRLDAEKQAVSQLEAFSRSLRRWDMQWQLSAVESQAADYSPPKPPGKTGKAGRKHQAPAPSAKAVRAALATLRKQAPAATRDQQPGWEETHVVDLAKKDEVDKARKDLDFLSHQSKAWVRAQRALQVIRKALRS